MTAALPLLALMDVFVIQIIASFLGLAVGRPLPFIPSALIYAAGLALTLILRARGGRIVVFLIAHAAGLGLSFFAFLAAFRAQAVDGGISWGAFRTNVEIGFVAAGAAALYLRGARSARKPVTHARCVAQFDAGLGVFLFLFAVAAMVGFENPFAVTLAFPYLLFSILTLALAKKGESKRGGLARRSGKKLLVPAATAAMLGGAGVMLLLPAIFEPARRAGGALKDAAVAAEPFVGAFLRYLFGFQRNAPAAAASASGGDGIGAPAGASESALGRLIASIVMWTLGALAALVFLAILVFGLAKLFKYLASRVEKRSDGLDLSFLPAWLRSFILSAARVLSRLWEAATAFARERLSDCRGRNARSPALQAYARLLSCAKLSGCRRAASETPREFARRLARAFPRSARKAEIVAAELEKEVYGMRSADQERTRELETIRRKTTARAFLAEKAAGALRDRFGKGYQRPERN